jgi:hypothetical protein
LVAEHTSLIGDLVRDVEDLTPALLAERLHARHRSAVITPEEDAQLAAAGIKQNMPAGRVEGDDPWARKTRT